MVFYVAYVGLSWWPTRLLVNGEQVRPRESFSSLALQFTMAESVSKLSIMAMLYRAI